MLYLVQRLLIGWGILIVVLWLALWSGDAAAGAISDTHQLDTEALSHCEASGAIAVAYLGNTGYHVPHCEVAAPSFPAGMIGGWRCRIENTYGGGSTFYSCHNYGAAIQYHYYAEVQPLCEDDVGVQVTHYATGTIPGDLDTPARCLNSCVYNYVAASIDVQSCTYNDANNNGQSDDGEVFNCATTYQNTGDDCTTGDNIDSEGNPNYFDCTNVDCSPNPAPGGGSGDSGTGDPVDPQTPTPQGPGGDGDSETPDPGDGTGNNPGGGSGAGAGGYGDCNPQSNPDCAYAGSGSGSGVCSAQPSCTGDPVQCAILYQEWASMCYDGGEFTNPSNCQLELDCEGDVLLCEIIRQERQQYCDAYVGDGTLDLDPTDNVDFEKDLKSEEYAETIELPGAFDQSGLGAGACPADYVVGTSLGSFSLSFASLCSVTPAIRIFVIISALMAAVYIVVVGGKGNKD